VEGAIRENIGYAFGVDPEKCGLMVISNR